MNRLFLSLLILSVFTFSCKEKEPKEVKDDKETVNKFDDSDYVINDSFKIGDVRRYGIFPDSSFANTHPFSKESKFKTVLDLAEKTGIELYFPEGYYRRSLILDSRRDITLKFNKAAFKLVHITDNGKNGRTPKNISLKGELIAYDRLGITRAENISIDTIYIKTDLNKTKRRSRGCHIYVGCNNIKIGYLEVDDVASGEDIYKHSHAALAVDGIGGNPVGLNIKKVHIKSSDRHGVYLTGREHQIGEIIIDKFGIGSSEGMSPIQDADNEKGENKEFKALWINKCYDSFIGKVIINEQDSKGKYTAHFDYGDKEHPVSIQSFKVINDNPNISILEDEKSGVVIVEKE